jgi:Lantibiotic dehydratase, N terminus
MIQTPAGFSPYVLFRRGTLGLPALSGMVPERTWTLVDEAHELAAARDALRAHVEDDLHELVPRLPVDQRRELLRARRAVHNDRLPDLSPATAGQLPERSRELLAEWSRIHRSADTLLAEADATLAGELDVARKTLADVALVEDFRRGIQLGGEGVYREVMAYAADPFAHDRKPSRRRRAESTITSFAYRVVFKPSPFGSFTEIGAQPWASAPTAGGQRERERVASARINIGLLAWMAHRLRGLDRSTELLTVRLNNSLVVHGDRVTFVRRPIEGADATLIEDRVVTARYTGLVRLLVAVLGGGELSERRLRDRLVEAGLSADAAAGTIDQLVKVGLCHRGLGLPDQTTRFAAHVAERLRDLDTPQAAECAQIFERTQTIEDQYAAATAERRTGLLAELRNLIHRLARVCGGPAPEPEALDSIVYEDVGTRVPAATWHPALLRANRDHLALFQRLVPVLDDATIERLGLYRFFVDRFGSSDVGLVEFYTAFAELPPVTAAEIMSGIMSGTADPSCEHVRRLRRQFFGVLRDELAGCRDAAELALDPGRIREFAASIPAFVPPWRSAAYRIQLGEEGDRRLAVLNGITTGNGVFFSRFCDLLEPDDPDGWSLRRELRARIAGSYPRQTDITATLGLNFNLHPRLTPFELIYPGSVPRYGAHNVLTLPDLLVRPDPATRRLVLVSTVDGEPVDLVPMNFLFPAAAPMLYRFLCAFAPTRTYRGGLWEQLDRAGTGGGLGGHRPRLLLGDLVLDRRSWRFDIADLPDLDGAEHHELGTLVSVDRWRRASGLPRHTFFRLLARRGPRPPQLDPLEERRQWALEARSARLHKPHYLDLRNPFLLYVFAKYARMTTGGSVIFQECLPAPDGYTGPGEPVSAEEFFVEFDLEDGDDAGS